MQISRNTSWDGGKQNRIATYAMVSCDGKTLIDIPIWLTLPKRREAPIELEFELTKEQMIFFRKVYLVDILATAVPGSSHPYDKYEINNVILRYDEVKILPAPEDIIPPNGYRVRFPALHTTFVRGRSNFARFFRKSDFRTQLHNYQFKFFISSNPILSDKFRRSVDGGNINAQNEGWLRPFEINKSICLSFGKEYETQINPDDVLIQKSELYLGLRDKTKYGDFDSAFQATYPIMELFAKLLSFITGITTHITCFEISFGDQTSCVYQMMHGQDRMSLHAANAKHHWPHSELLDNGIEKLKLALKSILAMHNTFPTIKAMQSLTISNSMPYKMQFLNLFSSLEEILRDYGRQSMKEGIIDEKNESYGTIVSAISSCFDDLKPAPIAKEINRLWIEFGERCTKLLGDVKAESILGKKEWKIAEAKLKAVIRNFDFDEETQELMKSRFNEFNRLPLTELFSRFGAYYNFDFGKFWPVFDFTGGVSLYQLRNRIAHQEIGPWLSEESLLTATMNLWMILDLIIMHHLGLTWKPKYPGGAGLEAFKFEESRRTLTDKIKSGAK